MEPWEAMMATKKIPFCVLSHCYVSFSLYNHLRHDAREVEHLSWQVCHVAVHKDKKRLDNTGVGGEAWGEGSQDPIDSSNQNATTRNYQEGDDSQDTIQHRHCANLWKLLKQVVQHLGEGEGGERGEWKRLNNKKTKYLNTKCYIKPLVMPDWLILQTANCSRLMSSAPALSRAST